MKSSIRKLFFALLIGAAVITGLITLLGLFMVFKSSDEFAGYWLALFCGTLTYRILMAASGVPNPFSESDFSDDDYGYRLRHHESSEMMMPMVNIDGTPMVQGSLVDVKGKSFGDSGEMFDPWNAERIHDTGIDWGSSNDFGSMGSGNMFEH